MLQFRTTIIKEIYKNNKYNCIISKLYLNPIKFYSIITTELTSIKIKFRVYWKINFGKKKKKTDLKSKIKKRV